MKKIWSKVFQGLIILVFVFGFAQPSLVLAEDGGAPVVETETVVAGSPPLPATDEPDAATPTFIAVEQTPIAPEENATEEVKPAQSEDLADVVGLLNAEGLVITDHHGDPLSLASREAVEVLTGSDPFFWNGTNWVGYTVTGTGCPANVTCLADPKPFQAAVNAAPAGTSIYVATGTYDEDVIINNTNPNLSFTAFNSITVDANDVYNLPTINNHGYAKVKSLTLNTDFGVTSGVYADQVIVNSGGFLSDALNLVDTANVNATVEVNMILYRSYTVYQDLSGNVVDDGSYYRIRDANDAGTHFEWDCGEPQIYIYPGTNYRMILKNPHNPDVIQYYETNHPVDDGLNADERPVSATLAEKLSAEERINDLILATNMSEQTVGAFTPWSNANEQIVYWNILGHVNGVSALTTQQKTYADYITVGTNDASISINNMLWFLWPIGSTNNAGVTTYDKSPLNTQFTYLKYLKPSASGCTDPASCNTCPFGEELEPNVGCVPIVCTFGNQLNEEGNGCEPIICTFGKQLNEDGNGCEPIVCTFGNQLNEDGNGCEPIVCEVGTRLNDAGNGCEPIVCEYDEKLVENDCVKISTPAPVLPANAKIGNASVGLLVIPVTGVRIIVAGLGHTCMTAENGRVVCWGLNASGQDGEGTYLNQLVPAYVKDLNNVINLTAGSLHTCALNAKGEVWCWGENSSGQLGNGTTVNSNVPVKVIGLPDKVTSFTGGEEFTCAQLKNKEVWCWGENGLGQLNDGTTVDRSAPVKSLLKEVQNAIAAGQEALLGEAAGNVDTWSNVQAALVKEMGSSLFLFGDRWNKGGCAINAAGQVKCWQDDLVSSLIGNSKPAYMVETGIGHGCALNDDGTVSCWGLNKYGQLGNGTNLDSGKAVAVKSITEANEIGVGRNHSCVLVGEGYAAVCWGENTYGQLGNDSTINSNLPVWVYPPAK